MENNLILFLIVAMIVLIYIMSFVDFFFLKGRIESLEFKIKKLEDTKDEFNNVFVDVFNDIKNVKEFIDFKESLDEEYYGEPENPYPATETQTLAKTLPEGWIWIDYDDGSGCLESPDRTTYFSYDGNTGEYKVTPVSSTKFFLNENYEAGKYVRASISEFKAFAENYVKENILNKE